MGYSAEHTRQTRKRILDAAGRLFRQRGYAGARIDEIMAEAGLTRGGFYQHFASKSDLFAATMREELEFTTQLRRAVEQEGLGGAKEAVTYYLRPGNREKIARGCTIVSNAADLARGDAAARRAFSRVFDELADEFAAIAGGAGACEDDGAASDATATTTTTNMNTAADQAARRRGLAALATCVGSVVLARAVSGEARVASILEAAEAAVLEQLDPTGPSAAGPAPRRRRRAASR